MRPFNLWLFGGGVLYTGLVFGVVAYDALKDWCYCCTVMHCISCCYEMLPALL